MANEIFANITAKVIDQMFPQVRHDLGFLLDHHGGAYGVDRTAGANPMPQPLANLDQAVRQTRRRSLTYSRWRGVADPTALLDTQAARTGNADRQAWSPFCSGVVSSDSAEGLPAG
jgi:hypothetical protein